MGEDAIIVAIVFGSILGMITIPMLISLAKKWIERNNASYDEEKIDRLAEAFIQHREQINSRVQNIETIIADEDTLHKIEEPDSHNRNTLHNDLNNKKRMQQ